MKCHTNLYKRFARNWRHRRKWKTHQQKSASFAYTLLFCKYMKLMRDSVSVCVFQQRRQRQKIITETIAGPHTFEFRGRKVVEIMLLRFWWSAALEKTRAPDHMPSQSPADGKNQHSSCATSSESKRHARCSFLAASAISLLGMTLLAAALLVHFLLLTSVARNGECELSFFL